MAVTRQKLSQPSFRQEVRVIGEDANRYGRTVDKVMLRSLDLNAELVRRGAARVYAQYNCDPALPPLQAAIKQARRDFWALPAGEQMPPWYWRQNDRSASASSSAPLPAPSCPVSPPQASSWIGMKCGSKRYCTQMTSCTEAQFHFRQCGLTSLDGNRDGVPCEKLCR